MRTFSKVIPFPTPATPIVRFNAVDYPRLAHALSVRPKELSTVSDDAEQRLARVHELGATPCH